MDSNSCTVHENQQSKHLKVRAAARSLQVFTPATSCHHLVSRVLFDLLAFGCSHFTRSDLDQQSPKANADPTQTLQCESPKTLVRSNPGVFPMKSVEPRLARKCHFHFMSQDSHSQERPGGPERGFSVWAVRTACVRPVRTSRPALAPPPRLCTDQERPGHRGQDRRLREQDPRHRGEFGRAKSVGRRFWGERWRGTFGVQKACTLGVGRGERIWN